MPSDQPLLVIYDRHAASAGEPPHVSNEDRSLYYGYFQNEHGDQWVFIHDPKTNTATLRTGDADWGTAYTMRGPQDLPPSVSNTERAWILTCWEAAQFRVRE